MKINKFAVEAPGSDQEVRTLAEWVAINPTKDDVRMIAYTLVVTDKDGFTVGSSLYNRQDCNLEPGGETVVKSGLTLEHPISQSKEGGFNVTVSEILFVREFHMLGEVEVPAKDQSCMRLEKSIVSKTIDGSLKVNILRLKSDGEGHILRAMVLLRNKLDHHLPWVEMKLELLDSDDGMVEETTDQVAIAARSTTCLQASLSWLKRGQLRNAKMRVGLYVYSPVHREESSAESTFTEEELEGLF
jgi:hypothetical protein